MRFDSTFYSEIVSKKYFGMWIYFCVAEDSEMLPSALMSHQKD